MHKITKVIQAALHGSALRINVSKKFLDAASAARPGTTHPESHSLYANHMAALQGERLISKFKPELFLEEPLQNTGLPGQNANCLPDSIPFLSEMGRKDRAGAFRGGMG